PSWQVIDVPVDAGALQSGENSLHIAMARRGGPAKSYGLFHSIEIAPADQAGQPAETWPALSPAAAVTISGATLPSPRGLERMVVHVEGPARAWLVFQTGAAEHDTTFRVSARTVDSGPSVLLEHAARPGAWR